MPAPVIVAAGQLARKVVLRRLFRLGLLALPIVLVTGLAMGLLVTLLFSAGGDDQGEMSATGRCSSVSPQSGGADPGGLTAEQLANAQTIVAVGRQLRVPPYGRVVAVATALQESSLTNLPNGHLDSLGLFQQRSSWGPAAERLNPQAAPACSTKAATAGRRDCSRSPGSSPCP